MFAAQIAAKPGDNVFSKLADALGSRSPASSTHLNTVTGARRAREESALSRSSSKGYMEEADHVVIIPPAPSQTPVGQYQRR